MTGDIGNAAQTLLIANQTINIGGRPEWIQTLPKADLETARDRLHSAARRHEGLALAPLLLPVVVAFVVAAVIAVVVSDQPVDVRHRAGLLVVFLSVLMGAPVWFGLYDVRRRHRRVVEAAERR